MNEYNRIFKELRHEVWKVGFLNAFLNAAIVFFVGNIVCTIIRVSFTYSIIPAFIVFLWSYFGMLRRYTLKRIEEGNPEVAEILRTANDNSKQDNLVVHALFLDLMQRMETVTTGIFINPRSTALKLAAIGALAFVPLLITNFTPVIILDNPFDGFNINLGVGSSDSLVPLGDVVDAPERDIYGDQDVLQLGNERLDITAGTSQGGIDFTNPDSASGNAFRYNDYPVTVDAEQTTAGTGGVAAESSLINDFSCKTKKTC